jgi:hypothetical protein
MNRIRTVCRRAVVLAGIPGALPAFGAVSRAAFAARTPPFGGLIERRTTVPAERPIAAGGMPGWQIALIAAAAALSAAAVAVILDRVRAARRRPAAPAPAPGQPATPPKGEAIRRLPFAGLCLASAPLLLASTATPALAGTPAPVTIHSTVIVGPFTGTWSASGGISDSGTLAEPTVNFVGNGELHIVRNVTGSQGTFTLRIDSTAFPRPDGSDDFTGQWAVIAGTGAYAHLHGQGTRSAVSDNGVVTETLTGTIHPG